MGLFDMIKNAGELAGGAAQLDDVVAEMGGLLKAAYDAGKVDERVWNAFNALKDADLSEKLAMAEKFSSVLETYMEKLPEELKPAAEKLNHALGLLDKAQNLF